MEFIQKNIANINVTIQDIVILLMKEIVNLLNSNIIIYLSKVI